jgi:ferritin-like metal-binding protein YciE
MYSSPNLIAKYVRVLQKAENQYGSFLNVFGFKASNLELINYLKQLHHRAADNQKKLTKIISVLHPPGTEHSADGLKGIFKEGYYMINGETDAYTIDSIIVFSVIQASYYKINHYLQLLTYLKQTYYTKLGSMIEEIIEEEESSLLQLQELQVLLHRNAIANDTVVDQFVH